MVLLLRLLLHAIRQLICANCWTCWKLLVYSKSSTWRILAAVMQLFHWSMHAQTCMHVMAMATFWTVALRLFVSHHWKTCYSKVQSFMNVQCTKMCSATVLIGHFLQTSGSHCFRFTMLQRWATMVQMPTSQYCVCLLPPLICDMGASCTERPLLSAWSG